MKVIYSTCYADPWVHVAKILEEEHGFEPVYWIGQGGDDNSQVIVPEVFPNAIYQFYFDAWKGIFPKEIEDKFVSSYIDIDFLKDYSSFELQAIKMMDRMDPDRHCFNFMERQTHFRNLLKYWTACINKLKPDLVIFGDGAYQLFDYVLYLICRYKKIQVVAFAWSQFPGRIIPISDIYSIGTLLDRTYAEIFQSARDQEVLKYNLPIDIVEILEKVKIDYSTAEPLTMKMQVKSHKQSSGIFELAKKFFIEVGKLQLFGNNGVLISGIPTYHKERNKRIEDSKSSLLRASILTLKSNSYKSKLKNHYNTLVEEPDYNRPYIFFALHYQPERTTSPSGDIFVDQRLCIEVLAKNIPPHYLIYVKEHRSQFYAHMVGQKSRMPTYYEEFTSYPQVRLMPLNANPFELIRNAQAVATITGTVGWEAMVLGKPVIVFGLSWYEKYVGVLKIIDDKSAEKIIQFIENFKFDERNLLSYLNAFSMNSVRAYYAKGLKKLMKQDELECVSNLVKSVIYCVSK